MIRRSTLALSALVVLLLVSSCRREDNSIPPVEEQDRIIATASLTDDPNVLRITWFPVECETFKGVESEVDEEFANLRVRVTVDVVNCPPGGFSETTVDLGEPLGDRKIWDRAFGDTVALTE
jgi:hypothetical protein